VALVVFALGRFIYRIRISHPRRRLQGVEHPKRSAKDEVGRTAKSAFRTSHFALLTSHFLPWPLNSKKRCRRSAWKHSGDIFSCAPTRANRNARRRNRDWNRGNS